MDPQATATATVAARHTPPDRARAIATPTAAAHRTLTAAARATSTPMAAARHRSTERARAILTPTVAARRTPMGVAQPTPIPTAGLRPASMGRARRIRTFTVVPRPPLMARARITPALMATALRIIRPQPTMAIIRPRRSTITDHRAPTAVAGPPALPQRAPQRSRVPRSQRLRHRPTQPLLHLAVLLP